MYFASNTFRSPPSRSDPESGTTPMDVQTPSRRDQERPQNQVMLHTTCILCLNSDFRIILQSDGLPSNLFVIQDGFRSASVPNHQVHTRHADHLLAFVISLLLCAVISLKL